MQLKKKTKKKLRSLLHGNAGRAPGHLLECALKRLPHWFSKMIQLLAAYNTLAHCSMT